MTRKKKLFLNIGTAIAYEAINLICSFILPRLIISHYGSAVNGLVNSITQFLGFISLCDCGVGAVVRSSLYKPLAENDENLVSRIYRSSENFFRKIAYVLVAYTIVLLGIFPYLTSEDFDPVYIGSLILVISITSLAQYYFGMTNKLLTSADQKSYISQILQSVTLVLNTVACVFLIEANASIQVVKLVTSLIFLIRPIVLAIYVKKNYHINRKIEIGEEPIKQKWNGLSQHIAAVVLSHTDTFVLTIFSSLENVSIYGIYYMVVAGVRQLVETFMTGFQAMLGNMLAKKEMDLLGKTFESFEWMVHTLVTFAYTMTSMLIVPFVTIYTKGIEDANYVVPLFAIVISIAQASYCIRIPYNTMVLAAGHYKQTQASAIIEAAINVIVSILMVNRFGLVGVAFGTLGAMIYRSCYLAIYLKKNILRRSILFFVKHIVVDLLSASLIVLSTRFISSEVSSYWEWTLLAIKYGIICIIELIIVNLFFYRRIIMRSIGLLKKKNMQTG